MTILLLLLPGAEAFASMLCVNIYSKLMYHPESWDNSSESSLAPYFDEAEAAFQERVSQVESGLAANNPRPFPRALALSKSLNAPVASALLTHTLAKLRGRNIWEEPFIIAEIEGTPRSELAYNRGLSPSVNLSEGSKQALEQTAREVALRRLLRGKLSNAPVRDIEELERGLLVEMDLFLRLDRDLSWAQESGDNREVDRITKDLGKLLWPLEYYFAEAARAHIHRQAAFLQSIP